MILSNKVKSIPILFLFITAVCYGQELNFSYTNITINEGLAHNTVECIYKDSDGFVWLATHYGLSQYDGYTIKTFRKNFSDSNSISSNRITTITEDEKGFIWVGTSNGLNRLDKKTNKFTRYLTNDKYESIPSNQITCSKTIKGKVWFGTNEGLAYYNESSDAFVRYIPKHSDTTFRSLRIYDIVETKAGELYITSENNCIHKLNLKTNKFIPVYYKRASYLTGNYRKHIIEDHKGQIWISALSHGLVKLNPKTGVSEIYTAENSSLGSNLLNGNLSLTSDNKLWISSDGYGIILYDIDNNDFSTLQNELENRNIPQIEKVYSILIDEQNIVWLGSFNNGLTILNPNPQKFSILKAKNTLNSSLQGNSALAIFEDSKGRVWVGTDGDGLFLFSTDENMYQFKHDPHNNNSISSDRIVCINEDYHGNILLGSYTGGFMSFNVESNTIHRFLPRNDSLSIASPHVWFIHKQSEHKIWLGLLTQGVDLFNPTDQSFTHYGPNANINNRINNGNINSIIEDTDGDIWFGTGGAGINILNKENSEMLYALPSPNADKLLNNEIRVIFQDSEETIWLATEDGGLYSYDKTNKKLEYFSLSRGLQSNIVTSIIEDSHHNLWLGIGNGILKFNVKTKSYRHFDAEDGLQGNMCNRNAICKLSDGTILIGLTNGVSAFHPDSIFDIQFTPKVFLTQLRIQNKIISTNDTIHGRVLLSSQLRYMSELILKPKDKTFTLEFAAANYTLPSKGKFRYMLEGFETKWITTDASRRFATYTNLDPGKYVFKVNASNSDEIWSDEYAYMNITILPTFWRTIWFKAIVLFLVLLIIYSVYRYLLSKREKQYQRDKMIDEQKIIHLEKEKLEAELNNQTFNVIGRNKTLIALKRRLSILAKRVDKKNEESLLDIIDQINKELNVEKDWKHIEPRLDKVYNNFMTILKGKHSDLTLSELRIAAYVRMGLSTKEISELMQKTTKAVENDRYRLRRKLEIQSNNSLKKYLLDL